MKKSLSNIVSVCIFFLLLIFAVGCTTANTDNQSTNTTQQNENTNNLGNYKVDIIGSRLVKDYEGKDVIIINYNYTNVSDDNATSFSAVFDYDAYQNGVELIYALKLDDSAQYNGVGDVYKKIKKGTSIEIEVAYYLNDTFTDVVAEVKEQTGSNDDIVTKTLKIS